MVALEYFRSISAEMVFAESAEKVLLNGQLLLTKLDKLGLNQP
jgi:hypothetical protein